jgi:hypothetical protein
LKQQQKGNHHAQVGRGVGELHRPWEHRSSVQAQRPITSQILSYMQGYPQLQPVQHGQVVHQQPPYHGTILKKSDVPHTQLSQTHSSLAVPGTGPDRTLNTFEVRRPLFLIENIRKTPL